VQQIQVEGYQYYNACMHLGVLEESTNNMEEEKIPAIPVKKKFNKCPQNKPMQNMY
jgi:hypothetical protein